MADWKGSVPVLQVVFYQPMLAIQMDALYLVLESLFGAGKEPRPCWTHGSKSLLLPANGHRVWLDGPELLRWANSIRSFLLKFIRVSVAFSAPAHGRSYGSVIAASMLSLHLPYAVWRKLQLPLNLYWLRLCFIAASREGRWTGRWIVPHFSRFITMEATSFRIARRWWSTESSSHANGIFDCYLVFIVHLPDVSAHSRRLMSGFEQCLVVTTLGLVGHSYINLGSVVMLGVLSINDPTTTRIRSIHFVGSIQFLSCIEVVVTRSPCTISHILI